MTLTTGAADHRRILACAQKWRGRRLAIATVVETWRSAPCPVGTHMLIHEDGRFAGSVSGGCVEADVLQIAADILGGAPASVRHYGVTNDAAWDVGLPCGGNIVVLVQPLSEQGLAPELLDQVSDALSAGKQLLIGTDFTTGKSQIVEAGTPDMFVNVYAPPRRLLIIGAVEIGIALANMAQSAGMEVTVIDPRARFLTTDRFPGQILDDRWPDEAVAALKPDSRTAVVTLSHDIKIDDPALMAAIASAAGYIGALGSRASHAARIERLQQAGATDAQLSRIDGPAGVAISAITSAEIALSIMAGIVRKFNDGLR